MYRKYLIIIKYLLRNKYNFTNSKEENEKDYRLDYNVKEKIK